MNFTVYHEEVDGDVLVTMGFQRGLLLSEHSVRVRSGEVIESSSVTATGFLEFLAATLRKQLSTAGFPTDEHVWIRVGEREDWRPDDPEEEILEPYELRSWINQLWATTEPLSKLRIVGALLDAVNDLERHNLKEPLLREIIRFAMAYHDYKICGRANELAATGEKASRARASGPKAKQERSAMTLKIVWRHAERHWAENPHFCGDQSNTAGVIAQAVNDDLRLAGLKPLKAKTIADYIRRGKL